MSVLLALDQASKTSGWAIYKDGKLSEYGKFTFDDDDFGTRLMKIRNEVIRLIQQYEVTEVAIEDIQLQNSIGNNVVTYRALAEVRGVLEELFTELKIPYQVVFSGTWKSALGIKGARSADQKRAAQAYVLDTHGVKAIQDTCDAICIGDFIVKTPKSEINNSDGFDWSE